MRLHRACVVGGGAWGTALASVAVAGGEVVLWAREPEVVEAINAQRRNPAFLPDIDLPEHIRATAALEEAAMVADFVLLAAPAQHVRAVCRVLATKLKPDVPVVICAKGIEIGSGRLMSEVVAEELPQAPIAVLSGPTFAGEVARGLPTAVTVAAAGHALGEALQLRLARPTFRIYQSLDPVGAEIGGAVKNVLAIACGIVVGRKLGDNARAALITRGLAELMRLGYAKGGKVETMMGLSGLGDLVLTCSSPQSRNMSLGIQLGEGRTLAEIQAERRTVAEGVYTARAIAALSQQIGVEMPLAAAVEGVLHRGMAIDATIEALLARPYRAEWQT